MVVHTIEGMAGRSGQDAVLARCMPRACPCCAMTVNALRTCPGVHGMPAHASTGAPQPAVRPWTLPAKEGVRARARTCPNRRTGAHQVRCPVRCLREPTCQGSTPCASRYSLGGRGTGTDRTAPASTDAPASEPAGHRKSSPDAGKHTMHAPDTGRGAQTRLAACT
jgi:hypothetical protein